MSHPLPTQVRIHRTIREIPRDGWNALLDDAGRPFLDHRYLCAVEDSGVAGEQASWRPRHLAVWRGGRLVAAAPSYLKDDGRGEFVFDATWGTASERLGAPWYPKLVIGVPFTPVSGRRLLVAAGEDVAARSAQLLQGAVEFARAEELSSIHAHFHLEEESAAFEREGFAGRLGVQYQWRDGGHRSWDEFLGAFRSARRNQIRREQRELEAAGISFRTLRGPELARVDPAEVDALYLTTVERNFGERFVNEAFFAALLATMPEHVEFTEARRAGKRIAGAFNLVGPSALYGRYWGATEEHAFLHFGVCLYHPVAECIRRGVPRFEPGAGGEHKLTRGLPPALTYSSHLIFQPTLDAAVRRYLETERAAILSGLPSWRADSGLKSPGRR